MVFSIAVHTTLFVQIYTNFTGGLNSVFRCRGLKSRPTLAIFILIILSFTMATIYWAVWMASITIHIRLTLVENISMELSERTALTNAALAKPILIEQFVTRFTVL
jgi:hypothetical protein